jgi:hypothetical protein
MQNRLSLTVAAIAGVGAMLSTGSSPAAAAPTTAQPAAAYSCHPGAASLTVQHRAPVHTQPSGRSSIAWIASAGKTYRIGGYCTNSAGNRWYCVAGCDFSDTPTGRWIWEEYFRD